MSEDVTITTSPTPEPPISPEPSVFPEPEVTPEPSVSPEPVVSPLPSVSPGTPAESTQTGELTAPPSPVPDETEPLDLLAYISFGLAAVFAVIAAVLAVLLFRAKRRKKVQSVMPAESISVGKLHEIGGRKSQQDCFAVSPEELISTHGLLVVVADGMGGLSDGDKVSQTAVASVLDGFFSAQGEPNHILLSLIESANRAVNRLLGPNIGKSGSTMVAALIREGRFHYISVGDSRICLYRNGVLYQLNREHIYCHELSIQAVNGSGTLHGAFTHPKAAGLTSYLGMGQLKYIDIPAEPVEVQPGDKFILMSDGVYNALSREELSGALNGTAAQAAEELGRLIQDKAYQNQDNYTAVILAC